MCKNESCFVGLIIGNDRNIPLYLDEAKKRIAYEKFYKHYPENSLLLDCDLFEFCPNCGNKINWDKIKSEVKSESE